MQRAVDLVRREQRHPVGPHVLRLAHRHPHVGVHEVDASDRFDRIVGDRDLGPGPFGDLVREVDDVLRWLQFGRAAEANIAAQERARDEQRPAHVEAAVAHERVAQARHRACARSRPS